jgi:hypothetical protein
MGQWRDSSIIFKFDIKMKRFVSLMLQPLYSPGYEPAVHFQQEVR